jgi:DNA-binding NtrC family response regulator/pSer/pThr/pTyr-binding forkhead associated (FHA) protein
VSSLETELLSGQLYTGGDRIPEGLCLSIYHRDGVDQVPLVPGGTWIIGREAPSDVVIADSSLSRQHARLVVGRSGELTIDDLDSTNGSFVNGVRVQSGLARIGDQIALGGVTLALHLIGGEHSPLLLESHDRFLGRLAEEVTRARIFQRQLSLLMVRARGHVNLWVAPVAALLRPVDRVGFYGPRCVEILLPEAGARTARGRAEAIAEALGEVDVAPVVSVGAYPDDAASAGALVERCRDALSADGLGMIRLVRDRSGPGRTEAVSREPPGSAMEQVCSLADRVAATTVGVLILGETGTGKEVMARRIHERSGRRGRFCAVNCGGLPPHLVESTLFGHEKGAFTGATDRKEGVFESSSGGTILLDEIGELPAEAQASLLRTLDTRRVTRVGGTREIEVDIRVLAATHRDLEQMVREGSFRQDLLFRLNTVVLNIPPLRERREEIAPLVTRFIADAASSNGCGETGIDQEALALLEAYRWPGNVRELRNVVERGVVICQDALVTRDDLPAHIRSPARPRPEGESAPASADPEQEGIDFKGLVQRYECGLIVDALRACDWNQSASARRLRIPRRTLLHKMKAFGIRKLGFGVASDSGGSNK